MSNVTSQPVESRSIEPGHEQLVVGRFQDLFANVVPFTVVLELTSENFKTMAHFDLFKAPEVTSQLAGRMSGLLVGDLTVTLNAIPDDSTAAVYVTGAVCAVPGSEYVPAIFQNILQSPGAASLTMGQLAMSPSAVVKFPVGVTRQGRYNTVLGDDPIVYYYFACKGVESLFVSISGSLEVSGARFQAPW